MMMKTMMTMMMTMMATLVPTMIITRHTHWQDENEDENKDENDDDSNEGDDDNYPPCPLAECPLQAPFTCWFAATGAPLTMGGVCASIRDDFKGNVHNDRHND